MNKLLINLSTYEWINTQDVIDDIEEMLGFDGNPDACANELLVDEEDEGYVTRRGK